MSDVRASGFGTDAGGSVEAIERMLARPRDEVVRECKRYVVGQDAVLEEVVGLTYSCLQRMEMRARGVDDLDLPRACAFMLSGSTASGKSFIMKVVAKVMGLELVSIDCSGITGAGWVGDSVSSELRRVAGVMGRGDGRPVLAFWDETDKLVRKTREGGRSFDSQGNFLKLLDGGRLELAPEAQGQHEVTLDAGRVLNVFAGAFMGIEDIVRKRLLSGGLAVAGDGSKVAPGLLTPDELRSRMNLQDLVSWGFMPEFVGRFGAVVCVPSLSCESLRRIVKGSERSLERRVSNLLGAGREFAITDAAAGKIAREAHASGLGARRIDQITNHFEAEATVRLHADADVNRATLDVGDDGKLCLAFDFDEDAAGEKDEAACAEDDAADGGSDADGLPAGTSRFEPNERLISAVDGAVAGARWSEAAATPEGRELLARRLAHYQRWRVRDTRSVTGAELLLEAVIGYLAVNRDPDMKQTLGNVCALLRFAGIHMRDGWTYLDTFFFGRVEACGLRGLEERACSDPAYCSCDAVRALSCYRRYLELPREVRAEAARLAEARAEDAAESDREAAWLRADINAVADAVDKEGFGGAPLIF